MKKTNAFTVNDYIAGFLPVELIAKINSFRGMENETKNNPAKD